MTNIVDKLFEFQKEDVIFLGVKSAVLIANEMGTGKTYEAIVRDLIIREKSTDGPFNASQCNTLVVAPLTTLESTWKFHYNELTDLHVTMVDPKDRNKSWAEFLSHGGVFCVHWEALRLMPDLAKLNWTHIIADEVHRAKNRKAQQTRMLKTIPAEFKSGLSGTPVVNRPDEMWSILNWLYPNQYRSYWKFVNMYVEFVTEFNKGHQYRRILGPKNLDHLHDAIKPFYVRRRKQDVLKDLPEKYYTEIKVSLTPTQRRVYNQMRDEMIAWIGKHEDEVLPAPVVIAQLTRLQQFACAYAEFDTKTGRIRLSEPSAKLDALEEILDDTEEQVVVFSRFKQLISLLGKRLEDRSVPYVGLTGDTPQESRAGLVSKFQRGEARVFIGTIGAGGIGITLHAASTVVFLDRDWSPALNIQAEDRLHRIGQKNAVQVIDIMARNTVDLGRQQRLNMKWEWIRAILGDTKKEAHI